MNIYGGIRKGYLLACNVKPSIKNLERSFSSKDKNDEEKYKKKKKNKQGKARVESRIYETSAEYFEKKRVKQVKVDRKLERLNKQLENDVNRELQTGRDLHFSLFGLNLPNNVKLELENLLTSSNGVLARFSDNMTMMDQIRKIIVCFSNIYMAHENCKVASLILNLIDLIISLGMPVTIVEKLKSVLEWFKTKLSERGASTEQLLVFIFTQVFVSLTGVVIWSMVHKAAEAVTGTVKPIDERELQAFLRDMTKDSEIVDGAKILGQFGRDMRGIEALIDIFTRMYSRISDTISYYYFGINPEAENLDQYVEGYEKWYSKVENIVFYRDAKGKMIEKFKTDSSLAANLENLYRQGKLFSKQMANMKMPFYVSKFHDATMRDLKEIVVKVENSGVFSQKPRVEPILTLLFGRAGAGKTILSRFLAKGLCNHAGLGHCWKNQSYYRTVEQEFWDAYNNQYICAIDDFMQKKDTIANPNPEIFETIRMNNSAPYNLHMAEMSNKGTTNFTSRHVIYTSNAVNFSIKSIEDPGAFKRRLDFVVDVRPKPEFSCAPKFPERLNQKKVREKYGQRYHVDAYDAHMMELERIDTGATEGHEERFKHTGEVIDFKDLLYRIIEATDEKEECLEELIEILDNFDMGLRPEDLEAKEAEERRLQMWPFDSLFANDAEVLRREELVDMNKNIRIASLYQQARLFYRSKKEEIPHISILTEESIEHLNEVYDGFGRTEKIFIENVDDDFLEFCGEQVEVDNPVTKWFKDVKQKLAAYPVVKIVLSVVGTLFVMLCASKILTWIMDFFCFHLKVARGEEEIIAKPGEFAEDIVKIEEAMELVKVEDKVLESKRKSERQVVRKIESNEQQLESKRKDEKRVVRHVETLIEKRNTNGKSVCINCHEILDSNLCPRCQLWKANSKVKIVKMQTEKHEDLEKELLVYQHYHQCQVEGCGKIFYHYHSKEYEHAVTHCVYHSSTESQLVKRELQGWDDEISQIIISERVVTNLYKIYRLDDPEKLDDKISMNLGIFVKGRVLLTVRHFWFALLASGSKYILLENLFKRKYIINVDRLNMIEMRHTSTGELKESILITIPDTVPSHTNIVKHFMRSEDLISFNSTKSVLVTLRGTTDKMACYLMGGKMQAEAHDSVDKFVSAMGNQLSYECIARGYYTYDAPTTFGDCGAVLAANNSKMQRKLMGIHYSGFTKQQRGYAQAVTMQDLEKALEGVPRELQIHLDFDDFSTPFSIKPKELVDEFSVLELEDYDDYLPCAMIPVGMGTPFVSATKSQIERSPLYDMIDGCEPECKPANLRPVNGVDPMRKNLEKVTRMPGHVDPDLVESARRHYASKILRNIDENHRSILTDIEAIQGVLDDPYMPPMNRRSSPGYPWNLEKKGLGKTFWLGNDQYIYDVNLKKKVDERIEKASRGERMAAIFIDSLKDETRPVEKVDEMKTRVFCNGPQDMTIAFRKYFLGFNAHVMKNRIENEISVGIANRSEEWVQLMRYLRTEKWKVVAGDFKEFDGSLITSILRACIKIVNEFYNDGNDLIREVLAEDIYHSLHITPDGRIYMWDHSNTSGNPLTSIINSMFNSISSRITWVLTGHKLKDFDRDVRMNSYGDDNLFGLSPICVNTYNQITMAEAYKKIGMTYTDESKTGEMVPSRNIDQVAYLQRSFTFNRELGRYCDPLPIQTIIESLYWMRKCPDPEAQMLMNLENVIRELALHGKEEYELWTMRIIRAFRLVFSKQVYIMTYNEAIVQTIEESQDHIAIKPTYEVRDLQGESLGRFEFESRITFEAIFEEDELEWDDFEFEDWSETSSEEWNLSDSSDDGDVFADVGAYDIAQDVFRNVYARHLASYDEGSDDSEED